MPEPEACALFTVQDMVCKDHRVLIPVCNKKWIQQSLGSPRNRVIVLFFAMLVVVQL
jgi:hypothetical protein